QARPESTPFQDAPRVQTASNVQATPSPKAASSLAATVLANGGSLAINSRSKGWFDVSQSEELPQEPFQVTRVYFSGRHHDTGRTLQQLRSLPYLEGAALENPDVSNETIEQLVHLDLEWISLGGTRVTDEGAELLTAQTNLRGLGLE